MNFSLPELPEDGRQPEEKSRHTSAYDALRAKLGHIVPETQPKAKNHASEPPTPSGADDDGYEINRSDADEAVAAMPPNLPAPLAEICKWLSWIMVPLIMPVINMILVLMLSEMRTIPFSDKLTAVLVAAGLNTVLPMVLIGVLKVLGIVHDVGLNSRRERLVPYIIILAGLIFTALFLRMQGAPEWMWATYIGAAVASAICCTVNFGWKISAHATGAAGVIGTIAVLGTTGHAAVSLQWWLFGACLLTGLMGSARVFLRRHTDLQVLAGYICGFCCVYFTTLILCH